MAHATMKIRTDAAQTNMPPDRISTIESFLMDQASLDTLRFITCGSVDDGKSTLIGQILHKTQQIYDDQIMALTNHKDKSSALAMDDQGQDDMIDYAMLLDGLSAEREQGITIDVAYRFFSTPKRKFIVADTPGHIEYTRNMITGASTCDLAIILVDATKGILEQTRRHSFICSLLNIQNIVVAVNKMDLVGYSEATFRAIEADYLKAVEGLKFNNIYTVPTSALKGENLITPSQSIKWFTGKPILQYMEDIDVKSEQSTKALRLPIQWVNRANSDFRGFAGLIAQGTVTKGQTIKLLPSGQTAIITDIILGDHHFTQAGTGQSVTVTLDRDIDISRGDVIVDATSPCEVSESFETSLVWMDKDSGFTGRHYLLKMHNVQTNAQITTIKHVVNINNFEKLPANKLECNDVGTVNINLDIPVPFEPYTTCPTMGSFILIDKITNKTVAAGMIHFALRRSTNVHHHHLDVDKAARQRLNGHKSKVLWFTGLSGSGKSTIANALEKRLYAQGIRSYILDGDNIRHGICKDLGFTNAARIENIRRVSEIARLMVDAGLVVIVATISPYQADRQSARDLFEKDEFIEVFVDTSLDIAEQRDPKGLYKKARAGEIPNFTGINAPYEIPENPDIHIETSHISIDETVDKIIDVLNL